MDLPVTRRAALLAGVALVAACTQDRPSPRETTGPSGAPAARPVPPVATSAPTAPAAGTLLYRPPAGEPLPNFKRVAGQVAQLLGTDPVTRQDLLAATEGDVALPSGLDDQLVQGLTGARATVEVVQYGGLQPVSARATRGAAIVVLRQEARAADGSRVVLRRALDLRLEQERGRWMVRQMVVGDPLPSSGASAVGERVLGEPRIDLPDTARGDIHAGTVSDSLLEVLLQLAAVARPSVTVLRTGHAERVLDGRPDAPVSDHFLGRAVDVHALDGVPVLEASPVALRAVLDALSAIPAVKQIGAPEGKGLDLDGRSRRFFTNLVHADHLHVAVTAPASPSR